MTTTAVYARYSSNLQRAASIDDQIRVCRERCAQEGWDDPLIFKDMALSGQLAGRPGHQEMMHAARAGRFNILLLDDLSRLDRSDWRTAKTLAELDFLGIRVVGVGDGIDSDRNGFELHAGLLALINSAYLQDLGRKTHRGQTGAILMDRSAGGRAYGYDSEPVTENGQIVGYRRTINLEEARQVVWIFEQYANGESPRAIAAKLNQLKVTAPRAEKWSHSSIYPDQKRGTGILANAQYIGRVRWNRTRWVKHPSTGQRKRFERPEHEWVTREIPKLAIVPEALWNRVQDRIARAKRNKTYQSNSRSGGPRPRYALSGRLFCAICGSPYSVVGKDHLGCSGNRNSGDSYCDNALRVRRPKLEAAVLSEIMAELASKDNDQALLEEVKRQLNSETPKQSAANERLTNARTAVAHLIDAVAQMGCSPHLQKALRAAEQEEEAAKAIVARLTCASSNAQIQRAHQRARYFTQHLSALGNRAPIREAISQIVGHIMLEPTPNGQIEARWNEGTRHALLTPTNRRTLAEGISDDSVNR